MILITGGAGYIGSHTNKVLNLAGHETVVFDNLCNGHRELVRWGNFVQGDLGDIDQLRVVFEMYPIASVMHFAAFAYVGESVGNPEKYYLNNLRNSLNLLQVMLENSVKQLVFSSSCAIYGVSGQAPITESHPLRPINPYGASKLMVENVLNDYSAAYGLRSVALRYFNAVGADPDAEIGEWHDPEPHLLPRVLDVAAGKMTHVSIWGNDYSTPDGTCIRDYIHVTDLATAHLLALQYLQHGGVSDSFNLGNGNGFSVKEVIAAVCKVTGREVPIVVEQRREGDPPILVGSSEKAQEILGWQPEFSDLATIVESAWNWHNKLIKYQP